MSGQFVLSGERAQRAREMLRVVTNVLESAGVRYWLDGGTLLGIIREQRLLPWDTDMDIAIDSKGVPAMIACIPELRGRGFRVRLRGHAQDHETVTRDSARIFKIRDRKWLFFRGELLLDIFVAYRSANLYSWTLSRKGVDVRMSAPARFFDALESVEFEGKRYAVPYAAADYLTRRYGNWQNPVKEWNVFDDDHAIDRAPPPVEAEADSIFTQ